MKDNLLIIFLKNSIPGKVKTRLAETIGHEYALKVYQYLAGQIRENIQKCDCDKVVYYSEFVDMKDAWKNALFKKTRQKGNDLGERMSDAFSQGYTDGYKKICLIGTDIVGLTKEIVDQAFKSLDKYDYVIGPAQDGGYYLLGLKKINPGLFKNKSWSTETILVSTLRDIENEFKLVFQLPVLTDVDIAANLKAIPDLDQILKP